MHEQGFTDANFCYNTFLFVEEQTTNLRTQGSADVSISPRTLGCGLIIVIAPLYVVTVRDLIEERRRSTVTSILSYYFSKYEH